VVVLEPSTRFAMARLYRTPHTHNYGVEFSPFTDGLLAVASSQYFGVVGNGKQIVARCDAASGAIVPVREFETQDGVYDSSWSEMNPAQLVSALGECTYCLCVRSLCQDRSNYCVRDGLLACMHG
jgi:hypothetical protein